MRSKEKKKNRPKFLTQGALQESSSSRRPGATEETNGKIVKTLAIGVRGVGACLKARGGKKKKRRRLRLR